LPSRAQRAEEAQSAASGKITLNTLNDQMYKISIEDLSSATHFYYQIKDNKSAQSLQAVLQLIQKNQPEGSSSSSSSSSNSSSSTPSPQGGITKPKPGDIVLAKFSADNNWYRARVSRVFKDKATVLFVDYGNTEQVAISDTIASKEIIDSIQEHPPLAKEGYLAFITARPPSETYGHQAALKVRQFTNGKQLIAKTEYFDGREKPYITIWADDKQPSLNEILVEEGLAKVDSQFESHQYRSLVQNLIQKQETAASNKKGIWEYGVDPDEDEEDEY